MPSSKPHYDLVLVYSNFRRHNRYINIIKALGKTLRIGIYNLDLQLKKVEKTEAEYLDHCIRLGAELIEGDASCHSLMLTRMPDEMLARVKQWSDEHCPYQRALTLIPGPFHGLQAEEALCRLFGPVVILAQDLERFAQYEPQTLTFLKQHGHHEVVETGSACLSYPIFPEFKTDYLIAYPSTLSIPDKDYSLLYWLLRNYVKAFDAVSEGSVVHLKVHNVKDDGNYLSDRGQFERLHLPRPVFRSLLRFLDQVVCLRIGKRKVYDRLPNSIIARLNWLQNAYLFQHTRNLLDEYPAFGLEHFISGIRKGLITGYGTILWEALFQRVPVQNIDPFPIEGRQVQFKLMHDSYRMADWGSGFSDVGFSTIAESTRGVDFIDYLKKSCAQRPQEVRS